MSERELPMGCMQPRAGDEGTRSSCSPAVSISSYTLPRMVRAGGVPEAGQQEVSRLKFGHALDHVLRFCMVPRASSGISMLKDSSTSNEM